MHTYSSYSLSCFIFSWKSLLDEDQLPGSENIAPPIFTIDMKDRKRQYENSKKGIKEFTYLACYYLFLSKHLTLLSS